MIVTPFVNGKIFRRELTKAVFVSAELWAVLKEWNAQQQIAEQGKPPTNHIDVDAIAHRYGSDRNTGLLTFFDDLRLEGFRVRLTLAHDDPDIKGNCVRLDLRGHNRP